MTNEECVREDTMRPHDVEELEEAELKAKYSTTGFPKAGTMSGHTAFIQKCLTKGQKFFDSGDYYMEKQKMEGIKKPPLKVHGPAYPSSTGEAIPTPEIVPIRETSITELSKFTPNMT